MIFRPLGVEHLANGPPGMLEAMDGGPEGLRPAVGQFSYQQLSYWEATTSDPWVIATLTQGYKLQFRRRPPAFKGVRMTVVSDPNSSLALKREVAQLLEKGAIEPVDWSERLGGFFSIYFIIPKKDGGVRPILDLRSLNKFLKILPFRMLRITDVLQAVKQQHWFTTVDLKDAYFHVPIAPQHRPFLRFAFQDQVYQFRVLPFGLSLSPRVFTRCMAAALAPIQAKGLQQESISSKSVGEVPRSHAGLTVNGSRSIRTTSGQYTTPPSTVSEAGQTSIQVLPQARRYVGSSSGSHTIGPPVITSLSNMDEQSSLEPQLAQEQVDQGDTAMPSGPEVLEEQTVSDQGGCSGHDSLSEGDSPDRCVPYWLGGSVATQTSHRTVGSSGKRREYKYPGTSGSSAGSEAQGSPGAPQAAASGAKLAGETVVSSVIQTPRRESLDPSQEKRSPPAVGGSYLAPEPRPPEALCVASEGPEPLFGACDQGVQNTILNSRAPSTRSAYAYRWKLFSEWCSEQAVVPEHCPVPLVLRFLQSLLENNRAAATLRVYVAAISAHHVRIDGQQLGSHALVTQFLRGAQRLRPLSPVRSSSHVSSSVSLKSDRSKGFDPPFFSEKTPSSNKRLQYETLDSDLQTHRKHENFKENLLGIFQDLESKIITFLKNELEKLKKILQHENTQHFVKDFNENRSSIKSAALDLTLHYLREMKQDEAADALEGELFFIHQLKCGLKKKYQCVFEGMAKQGDSTLLNNIYTDLYITRGGSEQVNTEHEVRQIEVASRRHEAQEMQVECTHLFEAPEQDEEIRTVLTKGVAGIGKSVSVQKFVLDWAEGKENQDISFIFPLPFREMNLKEKEKLSLMDLITQFFPETKGLNLTRRNQFKVLFILDGLDECRLPLKFDYNETWRDVSSPASLDVLLTNLMKGNLLPSALVWITSRPAAASKIPPDRIDRLTEIRGFSDAQKQEYFRKRFKDDIQANTIIDHVKQSKSLFIMCHIPVFCWISATVLQNILEEKRNNDVRNTQADEISKTLQESNIEDTPKTLTQMYTHFLRFQIQQSRRKYDGEYTPDVSWDKDAILSLGKLAFHQLERNNLIFYDTDLEACGLDVYKASVYSGMCTQIFKEETGIVLGTMYCFVHLSIQEFIAALYAHLFLDINKTSVLDHESTEQKNRNETMIDFLKTAVDKALESDNGHLDLFLRFLLGLSLQSNRRLLRGVLTQRDGTDQSNKSIFRRLLRGQLTKRDGTDQSNKSIVRRLLRGRLTQRDDTDQSNKEIVQYIKQKLADNLPAERSINLFYCLNELNDQTLVNEIQTHLSKGSLSSGDLSPAQWSALVFVLLTSEEELEEFELQKFKKSDECLIRLSAVIKASRRALLNDCNLTDKSCSSLAAVLGSDTNLKELNMNNNNLRDSGVKLLCTGLKNIKCKLEILRLSCCYMTDEGCSDVTSALKSNPSHLRELDLSENNLGDSGVKNLSDLLMNPQFKLEKLHLSVCRITEKQSLILTSALKSNPSHLRELDLSGNNLGNTGVKHLCAVLKDSHCKLERLRLSCCYMTDEGCSDVSSALKSNPSHLRELDLSGNNLGNTEVKHLCAVLKDSHCKLERLRLSWCNMTDEGCSDVTSALKSNPSHLRELDLSVNNLGDSGVKNLSDLLMNPQFKLEKLHLNRCSITEKQSLILTSALKSNPSHLRELDLSWNELGNTGVKHLCAVLKDSHCKLERLRLRCCDMTDEGCSDVSSALKSNPSHLRELDLSGNNLGDSGVKNLSDLLMNPQFKLEKLHLQYCGITDVSSLTQSLTNSKALQFLKELDLSYNEIGNSKQWLRDELQDSNCVLRVY
ncbi:NLR family CARD domain-containing protein 3-like [Pimephales promelas]|uniref:NLR family CARD domain-containing protein 3-like n=1 Tax=Pimephales promelas TaxID=90988 RepID=UPI001955F3D4|nr:NLR family CARD domain-containing protein 3-like [Pimephales promelas]